MPKVSQLPEDTAPVSGDQLLTVDDPNGAPISKKATIANVVNAARAKGGIYVNQGVTDQLNITTTPVKLAAFSAAEGWNGIALNTTPDKDNNQISVANDCDVTGKLFLGASGKANTKFKFEFYVNGLATTKFANARTTGSATDAMSVGVGGILELNAGDVVSVYVNSDDVNGALLTVEYAQFYISD